MFVSRGTLILKTKLDDLGEQPLPIASSVIIDRISFSYYTYVI